MADNDTDTEFLRRVFALIEVEAYATGPFQRLNLSLLLERLEALPEWSAACPSLRGDARLMCVAAAWAFLGLSRRLKETISGRKESDNGKEK